MGTRTSEEIDRVSLLHRRSDGPSPQQDAVAEPPAAPTPAPPPSTDELDAFKELTALRDQLHEGALTRAEFDARRKELGV
jgi:hypothetical protein